MTVEADGEVVLRLPGPSVPSLENGPSLTKISKDAGVTRLLEAVIEGDGISGTLHLPKIYTKAIEAYVPDMRGWVRQAGWQWKGESATHFGGVKSPPLHAVDGVFSHIPSIGVLRLAVSPSHYAPEMTFARDAFVCGRETRRLHTDVCRAVDQALGDDLRSEIDAVDL